MKKSLLLLSIPALLLASCSSDDVVMEAPRDNAITFAPELNSVSRSATTATWTTPETFDEFFVYAYSSDPGHTDNNFFNDYCVQKNKETGSWDPWDPNSIYYFPDWHLKFVAYTPNHRYATGGITGGMRQYFNVEITPQSQKIKGVDLSSHRGMDICVAANDKPNNHLDKKLKMKFKHTLSKFTISCVNYNPALMFEVVSAGIGGTYTTGTFTYPDFTGKDEIEVTQDCWEFYTERSRYQVGLLDSTPEEAIVMGDGKVVDLSGAGLIFPQNSTNDYWTGGKEEDGLYLYISCRIRQKSAEGAYDTYLLGTPNDRFSTIAVPLKHDFQPGYNYKFTVNLTNGGKFAPESNNMGGEPVLGGEMKFSVTTQAWEIASPDTEIKM